MTKTHVEKLLSTSVLGSACLAMLLVATPASAAKIKCWTNKEGVRECGNVLPPEYAQQGHDELNAQGITVKRHERALTPEEMAERKRQKEEEEARKLAKEEQERQDRILLNTFANEDEILMARNGKITAIRTEIRLTNKSLNKAKERLRDLRKRAANLERAGKPVPANINNDIKSTQKQIDNYDKFIQSKKDEQIKINNQFESDMKRYKQLRRPRQYPTQ